MKSDPSQINQQAMMIARESASPKNRQSNLSAFLKDNHPDVPPVVYHGTADDITQFQHGHSNKKDAGWLGKGFYFTNNKSLANSYSMLKRGNNENVMPIHLSLKNPFQANMEHKNAIKQKLFSGDQFAPSDFTDNLIAKGHDGVILNYGDREGTKEYVVFNPTQIKSAIGNNGDYDPTHPDITKAKGGMVADPKKAARAALYIARKTFAPGGATDDDAFTAYHGTPHEFEPEPDAPYGRFRDTAIGSGEGAQAFGYGHYLAGNEGIAKSYRDALSGDLITHEGERPIWQNRGSKSFAKLALMQSFDKKLSGDEAIRDAMQDLHRNAAFSERKDIKQRYYDAVNSLSSMLGKQWKIDPGHMLETRVRAKPEHFLDWDKPLSEQHPHVQKALESFGFKADPAGMRAHDDALLAALHGSGPESAIPRQPNDPTGQEIHRKLVGGASEWGETKQGAIETAKDLHAAGIPGIRYLDASSRGPTGAPTHNYVVFDPKNIDIVRRYAQGGEVYSNHAPRHTMQSPAVAELKHLLTMHRDELRSMKGRTQYAAIDGIMKRISHEHGIAPSKLHNDWMSVYHQTPDAWVAGDRGNVVDRALKMTNRGGYAFGGSPAGLASATGAPINFAPAAGAFTGLPSPETLNLAPSKATLAAILASRPTTRMGSGEPVKFSPYVPPSIAAPTFNASSYNLPDNPLEEGQGGGAERWHPEGGGAPTGGTAELAAAAAAAAGPLGGGYGDSDAAAARGGRIHRADGGEAYKDPESRKMAGWDWRPLGEVQEQLGDLREIPSHVANFGKFMDETARRAATHGLTPRDLIKAYTITRSSIQRESRSADKARASGVPIPHDFTGSVRPEGAFGEWLHSPMGRRYLDAAEQGIVDHESIADAANVMKVFGLSTEAKALPWAAQNLPQHAKAVSDMVSRAMQRKSSPEEWRHFIGGVHGIGSAKAGFMASLLGRGDQPTLDARQVVLHTGNPTSEAKKPLARAGSEAVDRLAARQEAMGLKTPEGMEPYYQHLAHHAVWDKVGDEQTTHQDVINAMRHAATGGAIEDPAHSHPLAQAMAEIGLPMGDSRIHRADGGEIPQEILNRIVSPFSGNEEQVKRALEIAQGYKTPIGNVAPGQTGAYYSIKHPMGASEVSTKIKDIPGVALSPKREMSWEDLYKEGKGGSFINVGGDRSNLGRLTHINNKKLAWPIDLHAGAKYMMEPNPGSVWANNDIHASAFRNAILHAAEKGPVYGIYAPMGPMSVDSSHNMFDAVMAQIPGSNISKENIKKFNDDIKEARHLPANDPSKNRVKEIMQKWPGLENPKEASLFAKGIKGVHRAAIIKHMDKASWHKLGFPAIGMTRAAITDPEVFNAPGNVIGHRVVKFNPENIVGKETAMPHSTYTHPTSGEYVGDIPLVQRHYAMPDVIEQIVRKVTKSGEAIHPYSIDKNGRSAFRKMTEENKQIHPINQRMLDSTQLGLKRQSDYGLKNGGPAKSLVDIALNLTKGKK